MNFKNFSGTATYAIATAALVVTGCGHPTTPVGSTPVPTAPTTDAAVAPVTQTPVAASAIDAATPAPETIALSYDSILRKGLKADDIVAEIGESISKSLGWAENIQTANNGQTFACSDKNVRLWNSSGRIAWQVNTPYGGGVCAVSANASAIAYYTGPIINTFVIHQAGEKDQTHTTIGRARDMVFSNDGEQFLFVGSLLELLKTKIPKSSTFLKVVALAAGFDATGRVVFATDNDVQSWSGVKGEVATTVAKFPSPVDIAAVSRNGDYVAWASKKALGIMAVSTGQSIIAKSSFAEVTSLAVNDSGELVLWGRTDAVGLWNATKNALAWQTPSGLKKSFQRSDRPIPLDFALDGSYAIVGLISQLDRLDTVTGKRTSPPPKTWFQSLIGKNGAQMSTNSVSAVIDLRDGTSFPVPDEPSFEYEYKLPAWIDDYSGYDRLIMGWSADELVKCKPLRVLTPKGIWKLPLPGKCEDPNSDYNSAEPWYFGPWKANGEAVSFVGKEGLSVFNATRRVRTQAIDRRKRDVLAMDTTDSGKYAVGVFESTDESVDDDNGLATVEYWTEGGTEPSQRWLHNSPAGVGAVVSLAPDGQSFLVGWRDGKLELYSADDEGEARLLANMEVPIKSIERNEDNSFVAVTDSDHRTFILRTRDAAEN